MKTIRGFEPITDPIYDELSTPEPSDGGDTPGLHHYTCCDDDLALCGTDLSGCDWVEAGNESDEDLCIVCLELAKAGAACHAPNCPGGPVDW